MRNDIIELFTDIDDDLISGAMPEAQKPIELRTDTSRFSWKKFAAAAACLTAAAVGGTFALKALSGRGGIVFSENAGGAASESTGSVVLEPANSGYPEDAKYQYTGDFSELELCNYAEVGRIPYLSYDELLGNSDLIVLGTFVDDARQNCPASNNEPSTDKADGNDDVMDVYRDGASYNKLRIDKVFCGDAEVGSEIVICDGTYVADGKLMYIASDTLTPMIKGEQWVYFLRKQSPEYGDCYLPLFTEGRYPVPGNENTFVLTGSQHGVFDERYFREDIYADVKKMLANINSTGNEYPLLKVDYNAQYIRTNGYIAEEEYPKALWITNTTELSNYYQSNKEKYYLGSVENPLADQTIGFIDAIEKYDDTFFETNDLILVVLEEGSGSIRHSVKEVSVTPSGLNHIEYYIQPTIERIVPEVGNCDEAEWHIIIEISKEYGSTKCQLKQPLITDKPEFNDNTSTQIEKIECEDWTADKEFTMPEFPEDKFIWKKDVMLVSHNGETASTLYGGTAIFSVYLADLNGDGKRELVNLWWNGLSGLSANKVVVCDYANSKLYFLNTDEYEMPINNDLEIRDNVLYVLTYPINSSEAIAEEPLTFDMLKLITGGESDSLYLS